ncbi:FixH family protein [Rufibacter sp. XAAS-G3-1]|uniref:FixH family protein n=1 Tax=Rufibacter sp. XAAS-G3-1 TaxID=2729134 RepID=UPI0015E641A6|nr:FixH family protein [Rufibacter sp. XAAS-G3-1]
MSTHTTPNPAKQRSMLPYLIVLVLVSFAGYIGFMVYGAMKSEVNLVSEEYYAEELEYTNRMKQVSRAQQLETPIQIISAPAAEQLVIQFPAELAAAKGTVHLFRPSDGKLDITLPLQLNAEGLQHLTTANLKKGKWRVQVTGKVGEKEYYQAQEITL